VIDLPYVIIDLTMAAVGAVGTYYALKARRLFFKDIMGKVLGIFAFAFLLFTLFSAVDIALRLASLQMWPGTFRIMAVISLGIGVVAIVSLIRWTNSSAVPRTEP